MRVFLLVTNSTLLKATSLSVTRYFLGVRDLGEYAINMLAVWSKALKLPDDLDYTDLYTIQWDINKSEEERQIATDHIEHDSCYQQFNAIFNKKQLLDVSMSYLVADFDYEDW